LLRLTTVRLTPSSDNFRLSDSVSIQLICSRHNYRPRSDDASFVYRHTGVSNAASIAQFYAEADQMHAPRVSSCLNVPEGSYERWPTLRAQNTTELVVVFVYCCLDYIFIVSSYFGDHRSREKIENEPV